LIETGQHYRFMKKKKFTKKSVLWADIFR